MPTSGVCNKPPGLDQAERREARDRAERNNDVPHWTAGVCQLCASSCGVRRQVHWRMLRHDAGSRSGHGSGAAEHAPEERQVGC